MVRAARPPRTFDYRGKDLFVEDVPAAHLSHLFGTPLFVYSKQQLIRNHAVFSSGFASVPHRICYAVKANSNIHLLRVFAALGCGADVVSQGELYLALQAGIPPSDIVFAGVGKTRQEIDYATRVKTGLFNVESRQELYLLSDIASRRKRKVKIAIRVNPDVDSDTHPYIATAKKQHKFGVDLREAKELYRESTHLPYIQPFSVHVHLGSQIRTVEPYLSALEKCVDLIAALKSEGIALRSLDLGGGFGLQENGKLAVPIKTLAAAIGKHISRAGIEIVLEPGRSLVASAGVLITRVLYTKTAQERNFVIVDAGMNDFIRPSLYQAVHPVAHVERRKGGDMIADVVGPVCETGDFLAHGIRLNAVQPGDLLAVLNAGAYGYAMSSNYNSRLRPAEVLVNRNHAQIIRKRESLRDLMRGQ